MTKPVLKSIHDSEKMAVETDGIDTVVILNKMTDGVTSIQVVDEGFNVIYTEDEELVADVSVSTGGEVVVRDTLMQEEVDEE